MIQEDQTYHLFKVHVRNIHVIQVYSQLILDVSSMMYFAKQRNSKNALKTVHLKLPKLQWVQTNSWYYYQKSF